MTMDARDSKDNVVMFLAIFAPIMVVDSIQGWESLPIKEDMELERQRKFINKPANQEFPSKFILLNI